MSTRWQDTDAPRGAEYDARWVQLAQSGGSVHGEADLVEDLLRTTGGSRVLDAGCGTGRVAVELARRGYSLVGVDADHGMLDTARAKAPGVRWLSGDLSDLAAVTTDAFDLVVLAGNVMIFLEPETEGRVVAQLAERLAPGALLIAGFAVRHDRLSLEAYDALAAGAGLTLAHRWSTWDRDPYTGGDYAVSVHRRPVPPPPALRIGALSIDCADPGELADFYAALLDMRRIFESPDGGIVAVSDGTHTLAMMRVDGYLPPTWPEPGRPQQLHLDVSVTDLDGATAKAVSAGAREAAHQPAPEQWRVFLDPAGHPFCLTTYGA